jgi:FKBP-type peptidyl-prolyl cis-trans isomerase FklB
MNTKQEKISYIIGRQIGADFKNQGIELSFDNFFQGIKSSYLLENSDVSDEESQQIMTEFQMEMKAKHDEKSAIIGTENLANGTAFLEANKAKEGMNITTSGLQILTLTKGEGKTPLETDTVEVHYEGKLIDGTIFDSSYARNQTAVFPVNGVIKGWTEALTLMSEGDIVELAIPADLAYGENGAGQMIGPNATLLFKVELISVK